MKPKISVVLAAYNEERLIGACIQGLKNQTFPKEQFEIVIVDNNSTDTTASLIREAGIKAILYTKRQSAIFAKDYGVRQARGDIIVVTDADAIPEPNWLERIALHMEDKEYMCIGGSVYPSRKTVLTRVTFGFFDYFAEFLQFFGAPMLWGTNLVFRRKAYNAIGGFNTRLKTGDDWDFAMRVRKKFGRKSVRYFRDFPVKASPRKQESLQQLIPYVSIGMINFFLLFILRQSITYGAPRNLR